MVDATYTYFGPSTTIVVTAPSEPVARAMAAARAGVSVHSHELRLTLVDKSGNHGAQEARNRC